MWALSQSRRTDGEGDSGRPPGSPSRRASVPPRQPRGKAGRRGFCLVAEWEKQPSVSKRLMGNAILVVDQSHTGATYRQRCMGGDRCTEGSTYRRGLETPAREMPAHPTSGYATHRRLRIGGRWRWENGGLASPRTVSAWTRGNSCAYARTSRLSVRSRAVRSPLLDPGRYLRRDQDIEESWFRSSRRLPTICMPCVSNVADVLGEK